MGNLDLEKHLIPYIYGSSTIEMLPQRIKKSLQEVNPDKIFIYDSKPLILYFKTTEELTEKDIFKKYWNFSEAPIIFIETSTDIKIYNGFSYILENQNPVPEELNRGNL